MTAAQVGVGFASKMLIVVLPGLMNGVVSRR